MAETSNIESAALLKADSVPSTIEKGPKLPKASEFKAEVASANRARTVERTRSAADSGTEEQAREVTDAFFQKVAADIQEAIYHAMWNASRKNNTLKYTETSVTATTWLTAWPGNDGSMAEISNMPSYVALMNGLTARGYVVSLGGGHYSSINRGTRVLTVDVSWASKRTENPDSKEGQFSDVPLASEVRQRIQGANAEKAKAAGVSVAETRKDGTALDLSNEENVALMVEKGRAFLRDVIFSVGTALDDAMRDAKRPLDGVWSGRHGLFDTEDDIPRFRTWLGTMPTPEVVDAIKQSDEFSVLTQQLQSAGYRAPELSVGEWSGYEKGFGPYSLAVRIWC